MSCRIFEPSSGGADALVPRVGVQRFVQILRLLVEHRPRPQIEHAFGVDEHPRAVRAADRRVGRAHDRAGAVGARHQIEEPGRKHGPILALQRPCEHLRDDLQAVEAGVVDHRHHRRSAPHVQETPEETEQADRERDVDALIEMQQSEDDA